jgi:hypothetical protein
MIGESGLFKVVDPLNKCILYQLDETFGFPRQSYHENAIVSFNNRFFVSGKEGIYEYLPGIYTNSSQPEVYLSEIKISGDIITDTTKNGFFGIPSAINTSWKSNDLSFDFWKTAFNGDVDSKIFARMNGLDSIWFDMSDKNNLTYFHLAPGNYTFEMMKNGQIFYQLPIHISQAFWKTLWFQSIFVLSGILAAFAIARYRSRKIYQRKLEQEAYLFSIEKYKQLAIKARMNPHFIFNSLNSIQHFIVVGEMDNALRYVSRFGKLLRKTLENSEYADVPLMEEIILIRNYIELEAMRFKDTFIYEIIIDPIVQETNPMIPGMILQPFVENAILHGLVPKKQENNTLTIRVFPSNSNYIVEIEDNGIGREASRKLNVKRRKSFGLNIAMSRLDLRKLTNHSNDDTIQIVDLVDSNGGACGTKVILQFKTLV